MKQSKTKQTMETQSNDTFTSPPSLNEIRSLTEKSRESINNIFKVACDEAFTEILKNHVEKMKTASAQGKNRVYLYNWQYLSDKTDKRYTFNNIRIMDLLLKGGSKEGDGILTEKLRKFFNPDNKRDGYYVGFKKFFKKSEDEPTLYGIYVSWYKPKTFEKDKQEIEEMQTK